MTLGVIYIHYQALEKLLSFPHPTEELRDVLGQLFAFVLLVAM